MPLGLSKEEVAKLNQEQLNAYVRIHIDSQRLRRRLCEQASGGNRLLVLPITLGVLGSVAVIWFPAIILNPFTLFTLALALLFGFHWKTNRRIDALVQLLNIDRLEDNHLAEYLVKNGDNAHSSLQSEQSNSELSTLKPHGG